MSYQVELKQQDTSIRDMKYIVTLLVPDGRYWMGVGTWNGGNKKEVIIPQALKLAVDCFRKLSTETSNVDGYIVQLSKKQALAQCNRYLLHIHQHC